MSSTEPLLALFLATGLTVGFGHCIGMCGPIVVSLSLHLRGRNPLSSLLLYSLGRMCTYTALGGVMGLTGSFTGVASSIAHLQKGVMVFTGALILILGLAMTGWVRMGKIFGDFHNPEGFLTRAFSRLSGAGSKLSYGLIGLILGLLPCGPVYTALIAAARSGMEAKSPSEGFMIGAGVMLSFGLGTVPALLVVGKLADLRWFKWRNRVYQIGAILMILAGGYFIFRGIMY